MSARAADARALALAAYLRERAASFSLSADVSPPMLANWLTRHPPTTTRPENSGRRGECHPRTGLNPRRACRGGDRGYAGNLQSTPPRRRRACVMQRRGFQNRVRFMQQPPHAPSAASRARRCPLEGRLP